jgi:AraC family transcriptional regulator, transcriptional activator of pobA
MKDLLEIKFLSSLENDGFEIITLDKLLGKYDLTSHYMTKPHRIKFYNILYFTSGDDYHYVDFKKYQVKKGSLIFLNKDQIHSFSKTANYKGYIILFTDKFLSRNLINIQKVFYNILSKPYILDNCFEEFETIFKQLINEYEDTNNLFKEKIFVSLFNYLILKSEKLLSNEINDNQNEKYLTIFEEFTNLLHENYRLSRNVNFYAEKLSISPKHLNTLCRKFLNLSAKNTIDNFVILEAKRELISNSPIKGTAYKLGFLETTNFVKYFKKQTNISPSKFKEQLGL